MSTITSEFTKEQLQQIEAAAKEVMWPVVWSEKKAREHFSEKITPKVVLKLARIALASLEAEKIAEPVAKVETVGVCWYADNGVPRKPAVGTELYAAPPAPVALPVQHWEELCRQNPDMSIGDAIIRAAWWNHCAAMLQGADGDSPVIPDGWVVCSERMPGEVLAALQNVARLRRNLNDFCGDKSLIAKCLSEAEGALLNAVNRHSTMLAEPLNEAKNV